MRAARVGLVLSTMLLTILTAHALAQDTQAATDDQTQKQQIALERLERLQLIESWRQFAQDVGLTPQDMLAVLQARARKQQLQDTLRQEAAVVSTALESALSGPDTAIEAAERFLNLRGKTLAEMEAIDQDLVARLGAERDPRKLVGLMIMGVIDNGVRILCGIRTGTIGGVPTGSDAGAHVGVSSPPEQPIPRHRPRPSPMPP